jgi:hypothetical protein
MAVPISNVTRRQVYAPSGAGGAGPYAFTFEILANTDIAVYKDDTLLTLTTHYTVVINANGTGSVTITAAGLALAPASPTQYAIVGNRTIARTSDFTTGGDFFANTLNDELDQQTIFAQQNAEGVARSLAAPQTDPTSINMTLPRASLRANKALGFDASGNPVISDTLGTNRGNWAAGVLYYVRDIVKDTTNNNIWQVITQHTSSGSQPINTNADAAKWTLLVDAASATTSATNAAASASAASTSASNASTSASNASTSASNASTSASNASSSASAAATSASNAAASYDSFDDRYLGTKASDPTVDNDGNALIDGALYFDTTNNVMKVYDLGNTTWRRTTPTTSDQSNINAVNSNSTNINTVAGISANVTTVATNNANVTTVAGSIASVNTNATNIANINQNAANITAIQNASANATAAAASATSASGSATAAAASAAAASAVALGDEPVRPLIRPSLLLDFANTEQLDPRITFTRASTGTFYDGRTTAKAEENLLLRSQEFDDASWTKVQATITANSTAAPDGTTTADTVTGSAGTALKYIAHATNSSLNSALATFSIFAKEGTHRFIQVSINGDASKYVNFDLNGSGATSAFGSGVTSSVVAVANGYIRCIVTLTGAASTSRFFVSLQDSLSAAREASTASTGDIFLWGAQAEIRASVTAYTATTTQAITNYIPVLESAASGVARFDHNPTTGESLGLLIEEQRSNLQAYSQDFTNAIWSNTNLSIALNTVVAPDGTLTGTKLSATSTSGAHGVIGNNVPTGSHTISVFAKAGEYSWLIIRAQGLNTFFNVSNGTVGTVASGATASITSIGNGWYRCSLNVTGTGATSFHYRISNSGSTDSFAGDGFSGIYLWGAQIEAGAFATSYIPTVASQVTRAADAASMTGTNFSSWYNANEGTLYAEASASLATNKVVFSIDLDSNSNTNIRYTGSTTSVARAAYNSAGVTQADMTSAVTDSVRKVGFAYKANDFALTANAASPSVDSLGTVFSGTAAYIGYTPVFGTALNGTIKKIAYYPLRVTNAQLQGMTTV